MGQIWSKKIQNKKVISILFLDVTTFYSNIFWLVRNPIWSNLIKLINDFLRNLHSSSRDIKCSMQWSTKTFPSLASTILPGFLWAALLKIGIPCIIHIEQESQWICYPFFRKDMLSHQQKVILLVLNEKRWICYLILSGGFLMARLLLGVAFIYHKGGLHVL